jgi:two-component system, cell cycle sensor histidine kinase and response regulator CckA
VTLHRFDSPGSPTTPPPDRTPRPRYPRRPLLVPLGYLAIGLVWLLGASLILPALTGDVGPSDLAEALGDLALFAVGVGIAAAYELRYRASIRRAFDEREASERRFRAIFESSPALIVLVDATGIIREINERVRAMLGYEPDELIGRPVEAIVPDESAELHVDLRQALGDHPVDRLLGSGRHLAVRRKDGTSMPAEIALSAIELDGALTFVATVVDISERERAAEELRQREESFRSMFESNPLPMWVFDPETLAFLAVNDAAVARYGYSRDAFLGMRITDIRPAEDVDALLADVRTSGEGMRAPGRWRHQLRSGKVIDVEIDTHTLTFEGRPGRLVVARDVTEETRALAELQNSEERFRQVAEGIGECFWLRDLPGGELVYVSPAFETIWGRPRSSITTASPLLEHVSPDDAARVMEAVDELDRVEWEAPLELRITLPDGSVRWIRSRRFPIADATGAIRRVAGVAQDVTAERTLADRLRQVEKMEAIGQLTAGIAHDFNNVLTAIRGYAELVSDATPEGDPRAGDLAEIESAADRATGLIDKLLAFTRQQVLQPRVLDLAAFLATLSPLVQRLVGEDITLEVVGTDGLGRVRVDPVQIEQVMLNLAANARDAMPNGGRLTIETANVTLDANYVKQHPYVPPGRYVSLTIADSGEGMEPATVDRAFEPFFTTKGLGKGTGLGLATVYGVVKQSHGHVEIYSERGLGTTIKIFLPRVDAAAEPPAEPAVAPKDYHGTETILAAEDDPAIRALTVRALSDLGYRVLAAGSGPEALDLAAATPGEIDLLVTDVVMPGMSGYDLAARLRELRPALRVLYVSGYTENGVARHGIMAGEMAFLPKPFTIEALGRGVRAALDRPDG